MRPLAATNRVECSFGSESSNSGTLDFSTGRSEFSDVINSPIELPSSRISHNQSEELLGSIGSSGTLGFSDSSDKSRDLWGNSLAFKAVNDCKRSSDFTELDQTEWFSIQSAVSLDYPSSRMTFRDIELREGYNSEEFSRGKPEIVHVKKGMCYRCLKGSRFTEKEVCIVCDAKYCSNCVVRAMGSMPEGRKCVTCIGFPINESKRRILGKCSRMLKRLLNDLEVQQIMKAEKFGAVNQLPPEYVCVNGKPLCHEELVVLQSCRNPPKKLKPGNYWYDKVSGLWGKEGEKPLKIISPHLTVGGAIKADASNGNTKVFINGREITKLELRMLQLAGVQWFGYPHFLVFEDGSWQEEGQIGTKGNIWGKAGMKLVCAVLSLPYSSGDQVNSITSQSVLDYLEPRAIQKLLLIGYRGSGTSTIFKQAKILYKDIPFEEDEHENIKLLIQGNIYGYLGILLEGRERFEEESLNEIERSVYSLCPKLEAFSDWLLEVMVSGDLEAFFPAASREYAPLVEELWNDKAIQATYKRRSELEMLPSIASYFLERAVDILRTEYVPSDVDILYAEGVTPTNGLSCLDFSFPPCTSTTYENIYSFDQYESLLRFQLIRVQAQGLKNLEMFEDVRLVIFCVSLNDYDQLSFDGDGALVNKMLLTKKFFESIVTHPTYDQVDFLLVLNKLDLFEEKVKSVPLTRCEWFEDFCPVESINWPSLSQSAYHYIAAKFKRLYSSLTDKKLYVSMAKGLEPDSIDNVLKYVREILKWDEERQDYSLSDYSSSSSDTETSSFSH